MQTWIERALRGLEHVPHLGDMIVAPTTGVAAVSDSKNEFVRGLYVADGEEDDTIILRVGDDEIRASRPTGRPLTITDDELFPEERAWVPAARKRIADTSRAAFTLPDADGIARDLANVLSGTLERIEAPGSTSERQRWVIFHDREAIGTYEVSQRRGKTVRFVGGYPVPEGDAVLVSVP